MRMRCVQDYDPRHPQAEGSGHHEQLAFPGQQFSMFFASEKKLFAKVFSM
jgi:hypothetical protein